MCLWQERSRNAAADKDGSALKIQTHKMFVDTGFNSSLTVLSTIYQNFVEAAMKYYRYVKCMGGRQQQPPSDFAIGECDGGAKQKERQNESGTERRLTRDLYGGTCRYHS